MPFLNELTGLDPVSTLILAIVFGILAYFIQAYLERQVRLSERKQEHYLNLFRSIFELLVVEPGNERSVLLSDFERSWLFAPDKVVKACYEFLSFYNEICDGRNREEAKIRKGFVCVREVMLSDRPEDIQDKKKMEELIARIFLAIRRDMKPLSTLITYRWSKNHIKLYNWGILAQKEKSGIDKLLDGLFRK